MPVSALPSTPLPPLPPPTRSPRPLAGLIDENSCSAAKKLVLAYLGSIAASAHMAKVADAFETLKAGCTRRLERIAAPLEAMCEKEELCRSLGGIGDAVGSPAVALDHEGLLPMPKYINGAPPSYTSYETYLLRLIVMASLALDNLFLRKLRSALERLGDASRTRERPLWRVPD